LVGLDYQVGPSTRIGGTLGYSSGKDELDDSRGETAVKTTAISGFVTFGLGESGITVDAMAGYGWSSIDTTRNLTTLARMATGSTDGAVWSAALRASKAFASGSHSQLIPYLLIDGQKAEADAYTESGAGAASLVVKDREMWGSALEGGAAWVTGPQSGGPGLYFRLQGAWRYLLDDGSSSSAPGLLDRPFGFTTRYDGLETNSFRLEAAADWVLQNGGIITLGYRGLLALRRPAAAHHRGWLHDEVLDPFVTGWFIPLSGRVIRKGVLFAPQGRPSRA
jgi:uncharacterized protein with beta-barrel porin domain